MFKIFSTNTITRKIRAHIIPMFNTSAEGCGFFCPKVFIRYDVRKSKSRTDNKSFITKKRYELLGKKSNRCTKIAQTSDAIIHRIRLTFILILLKFKIIRFILIVLFLHIKLTQIFHHLKKRFMEGILSEWR